MSDQTPDTQPDDGFDTEGLDAAELALLRSAGAPAPARHRVCQLAVGARHLQHAGQAAYLRGLLVNEDSGR